MLRNKNFRKLWLSQSLSQLGLTVTTFSLVLWITNKYVNSSPAELAEALALNTSISFVTAIICDQIAGPCADKINKKLILLTSSSAACFVATALFFVFYYEKADLATLIICSAFFSAILSFQEIAFDTSYINLINNDELTKASGMVQFDRYFKNVAGPFIAGILYAAPHNIEKVFFNTKFSFEQYRGPIFCFVFSLLLFICSFAMFFYTNIPNFARNYKTKQNKIFDFKFGFKFIKSKKELLFLTNSFFIFNFLDTFSGILIITSIGSGKFDFNYYNIQPGTALVLWTVVSALGGVIGGLLVTITGGFKTSHINAVLNSMLIAGIAILFFTTYNFSICLIAAAIKGFFIPFMNAHSQAFWQTSVPKEIQGRVFSTRRLFARSSLPLGALVGGALGGSAGDQKFWLFVSGSLMLAFIGVKIFNVRRHSQNQEVNKIKTN